VERKIELLAPGGDIKSIRAAIAAGADAIYCGLEKFNARNRATNISFKELQQILNLAHTNNCEIFLTLNIIITDSELPAVFKLLSKLVNTSIDGIIIQDFALFYIILKFFPTLKIHASTQLTTHNKSQISFLKKLGTTRVNLSRELCLEEITELNSHAHSLNVLSEIFVHGSNCISFSGQCYMSSVISGNSGNRGRCSQPCRDQYLQTSTNSNFPLNIKDNSAYTQLNEIAASHVDSIKIEGRIKGYEYVYTVIHAWREQLNRLHKKQQLLDKRNLYSIFNRSYTTDFLDGNISKEMFIDNPRDNSLLSLEKDAQTEDEKTKIRAVYFAEKDARENTINTILEDFSIEESFLNITLKGELNSHLTITVISNKIERVYYSRSVLTQATEGQIKKEQDIKKDTIWKRLQAIEETEFSIQNINDSELEKHLFIPFSEINDIKKNIIVDFHGAKLLPPVSAPKITQNFVEDDLKQLHILISNTKDIEECSNTNCEIFFALPDGLSNCLDKYISIFEKHTQLVPWFSAILIGEDFNAAIRFLDKVKPPKVVTNNSGIAFEAYQRKIEWIAGPYMNITNSLSLLNLQEEFNCNAAFISNELSLVQLKGIKRPENMNLYYSIFHPIVLMTSRQCLFHKVTACNKHKIDDTCISHCIKNASITNLNNKEFFIEKSANNLHSVYNETHFLNTQVVKDFSKVFSHYLIDLRDIHSHTSFKVNKAELIYKFNDLLTHANQTLNDVILNTTNSQYYKGI